MSLAVSAVLLAGLGVIMHQLGQEMTGMRLADPEASYYRALDLIAADFRGAVRLEPTARTVAGQGRDLAQMVTTNRVEALVEDLWSGIARVGYRLSSKGQAGDELCRLEWSLDGTQDEPAATCLIEGLAEFHLELLDGNSWRPWPVAGEREGSVSASQVRVSAAVVGVQPGERLEFPVCLLSVAAKDAQRTSNDAEKG